MLIALRKDQFTDLNPLTPRYRDGAPHGARSPGPVWLICVNISIIRGVATGHRGQPLTANRDTDQTEVSS